MDCRAEVRIATGLLLHDSVRWLYMANVDHKRPLGSYDLIELESMEDLDLLRLVVENELDQAKIQNARLSPQQERLIRKALENCPIDALEKMKDGKS